MILLQSEKKSNQLPLIHPKMIQFQFNKSLPTETQKNTLPSNRKNQPDHKVQVNLNLKR